ncbi:hypothetical protein C7M53_11700 [Bacillus licheniformis]|uniref:hypothetical protein n=1 Tax=Bacillus licheniformis TaxID=1402 RepID=UPI000E73152A|nr:hypothetical protein [Bacillus licheniformis]AYC51921.1 hypothetical protein C7M53_11700 [Bacillus licheniformis]MEC2103648.1 hypothetical protein [Bacillus licheniformis]
MRYKVHIKDFCALVSKGQLETEQIYLCHEGHLFEKPGYKQVKPMDLKKRLQYALFVDAANRFTVNFNLNKTTEVAKWRR